MARDPTLPDKPRAPDTGYASRTALRYGDYQTSARLPMRVAGRFYGGSRYYGERDTRRRIRRIGRQ